MVRWLSELFPGLTRSFLRTPCQAENNSTRLPTKRISPFNLKRFIFLLVINTSLMQVVKIKKVEQYIHVVQKCFWRKARWSHAMHDSVIRILLIFNILIFSDSEEYLNKFGRYVCFNELFVYLFRTNSE